MKRILVTGGNGQLGSELKDFSTKYDDIEFVFTDIKELDITSKEVLSSYFNANQFDFCVNCAAYTAVDKAENEVDLPKLLNATAVKYLAQNSAKYNVKYIQISTDFVFSGDKNSPYLEEDETNPLNEYGRTKLLGETASLENNANTIVIRTSWLYSIYGNNFVKTMLKLSESRKELSVVNDQIGTPTYAKDLALVILNIIISNNYKAGVYHYSNEGVCSWYDFAKAIFDIKGIDIKTNPIPAQEFPTPAQRPLYSVMSKSKIKKVYDLDIPYWRDSLKNCLEQL